MEYLFAALERSVKSVQSVSVLLGAILLAIAFIVYMIRAITPQEYLTGIMKVFIFTGLCCCSTEVFEVVEGFGTTIAAQIEPRVMKNPFEVAYGLMISRETADKLAQLEEKAQQEELSEKDGFEAQRPKNQKTDKPEEPSGLWAKTKNFAKDICGKAKSFGHAIVHPIDSGKQFIISGVYGSFLKVMLHIISWVGAICIILLLFLQYAVGVIVRMFLPLAFACLCVPQLVDKGMKIVLVMFNICCWPIGFAIIQNMIGTLSMDTQLATILSGALDKGMDFSFMTNVCGVLAVSLLGTFGYLSVPAFVGMFVGVNVGTGVAGKIGSFLGSAAGAAAGMAGGAAMGMAGAKMGAGMNSMAGAGNTLGRALNNLFGGGPQYVPRQKTPEEWQQWVQAKRSASAKWEAQEGWKS